MNTTITNILQSKSLHFPHVNRHEAISIIAQLAQAHPIDFQTLATQTPYLNDAEVELLQGEQQLAHILKQQNPPLGIKLKRFNFEELDQLLRSCYQHQKPKASQEQKIQIKQQLIMSDIKNTNFVETIRTKVDNICQNHNFEFPSTVKKRWWTEDEDMKLKNLVDQFGARNWKKIASFFQDRTDVQCLHRWQKVLNPDLVKGPWTKEEDETLLTLVQHHGPKNWSSIAKHLPGRIGKQCRERFHNHLDPKINKERWTDDEDQAIIEAHKRKQMVVNCQFFTWPNRQFNQESLEFYIEEEITIVKSTGRFGSTSKQGWFTYGDGGQVDQQRSSQTIVKSSEKKIELLFLQDTREALKI